MAATFTRTIKTVRVYKLELEPVTVNGELLYKMAEKEYVDIDGSATKTDIRAAFKAIGVDCPKGTQFSKPVTVAETTYEWTLDDIMPFARVVEND